MGGVAAAMRKTADGRNSAFGLEADLRSLDMMLRRFAFDRLCYLEAVQQLT
jgi:hypothetical protein